MAKKNGLIQKLIVGKERNEDYARSTLPTNRKELFFDIFKGRFWKLVLLNIMLIVAFIPTLLIVSLPSQLVSVYGASLPFSGGLFVCYPYIPDLVQYMLVFEMGQKFTAFILLIPCLIFAGVILSGVFFIVRNFVWGENVFIANDFWKGLKTNILHFVLIAFLLGVVIFLSAMYITILEQAAILTPNSFLAKPFVNGLLKCITYIFTVFFSVVALFAFTITVTYKLKFFQLLRNSFLLTLSLLPKNVLFAAFAFLPFLLIFIFGMGFLASMLLGIILLFGFSFAVLVWSIYSHWVFDTYINDKIEGAVKNRGLYEKPSGSAANGKKGYFKNPKKKKIKPITDEEITLTELPTNFSRADLVKLAEEKEIIKKSGENWVDVDDNENLENVVDDDSSYEGFEDAMKLDGFEGDLQENQSDEENKRDEDKE